MEPRPLVTDRPDRVAVLRALPGIGDLLCLVPALRALRRASPDAHVTLLGLPQAEWFVDRFPQYLDDLVVLPAFPGLPERPADPDALPPFLAWVQGRFDLLLQMHGSGLVTNIVAAQLGARRTAGFHLPGQYRPDATTYIPYPHDDHEIHRHLRLLEHLGVQPQGDDLEFPLHDDDRAEAAELLSEAALAPGGYACLHAGAAALDRRWPAERFAAVGRRLRERGLAVVLTGTAGDRELAEEIRGRVGGGVVDVTGRTSVGGLAALIDDARLVVTNDSGPSHVAAARRVPSVVVFAGSRRTGSSPARWAPLDRRRHLIAAVPSPADDDTGERCLRDGCVANAFLGPRVPPSRIPVDDVLELVDQVVDATSDDARARQAGPRAS